MKNKNFEYVSAIAQEGSFSKAAQKLFVSQPALSASIKKLESELHGVPLFHRGVNPITLTEAGKFYLQAAEKINAIEDEIEQYFASTAGIKSGTLTLGSSSYFCTYVLPELLEKYTANHPSCTIILNETSSSDMEQKLKSGDLDLILDVETLDPQTFDAIPIGKEYLLLAVPAKFEINEQLKSCQLSTEQIRNRSFLSPEIPAIDLALFKELPFLLLKRQHDMYQRAVNLCHHAEFEPQVRLYLDQMLTGYNIAKTGQGITFFRDTMLNQLEDTEKLCYYKLDDEAAMRQIWISCKKFPDPTPLADDFMKFMMLMWS